jgi:hypothetical protein
LKPDSASSCTASSAAPVCHRCTARLIAGANPSSSPAMIPVVQRRPPNPSPSSAGRTWNAAERIAEHRALSPSERLRRTIEVSQVALRFASGRRR